MKIFSFKKREKKEKEKRNTSFELPLLKGSLNLGKLDKEKRKYFSKRGVLEGTYKGFQKHSYYLLDYSFWPFVLGVGVFFMIVGFVSVIHGYDGGSDLYLVVIGMLLMLIGVFMGITDMVYEGVLMGYYTRRVMKHLGYGFLIFLGSELLFFCGFFYSVFYVAFWPSIWVGCVWPPCGIGMASQYIYLSGSNTLGLMLACFMSFGVEKWLQKGGQGENVLMKMNIKCNNIYLDENDLLMVLLIVPIIIFFSNQFVEYISLPFSINDSVFGSFFYFITALHAVHVLMSLIWVLMVWRRVNQGVGSSVNSMYITVAFLYWKIVDFVWLLIWYILYCFTIPLDGFYYFVIETEEIVLSNLEYSYFLY